MAKYRAPEGVTGITLGGEHYTVGEDGCIEVPDEGNFGALLSPHGFTPEAAGTALQPGKKTQPLEGDEQ